MKHRTVVLIGLVLVASLVLVSCGKKITAKEIVARAQETLETTTDAHAVISVSIDVEGLKLDATAEVWEKAPNLVRAEVTEASDGELVGVLVVSDGQQIWIYEPEKNTVAIGPVGRVAVPLPQELITSLRQVIQVILDSTDISLDGEDKVGEMDAYKLSVRSRADAEVQLFPGIGTVTLWIDSDQWFPLKATYDGGAFGQGSIEVLSFEMNPGLPSTLFEFEVPEGATVVQVEGHVPEYMTLEEARTAATFPLLVPDYVAGGATLVDVMKRGGAIVLRYDHSPQVSFTIVQGPDLTGPPPPEGAFQETMVRGQSATAITDAEGRYTYLFWDEGGVTISIAGHIELDEALQVAESLK